MIQSCPRLSQQYDVGIRKGLGTQGVKDLTLTSDMSPFQHQYLLERAVK